MTIILMFGDTIKTKNEKYGKDKNVLAIFYKKEVVYFACKNMMQWKNNVFIGINIML